MNQPRPSSSPVPGHPVDSPASIRLRDNRDRMAAWLAADRAKRARPSLGMWAVNALWPLINGVREHPSASLALGALAQGLLRPAPKGPAPVLLPAAPVVGMGLALVRRHPKALAFAVAAVAGVVWLWSRSNPRRPPP
jgi:hypothetical protein